MDNEDKLCSGIEEWANHILRFIGEEAYATIHYEREQDGGYFVAIMESRPGLLATGFTKEQLLQDIIECAIVWDEAKKEQRNRTWGL